jgi:hypothetical protein
MSLPIEELEHLYYIPTSVLALDASGANVAPQAVTEFMKRGWKECVELRLLDGRTLTCTRDHRIRTQGLNSRRLICHCLSSFAFALSVLSPISPLGKADGWRRTSWQWATPWRAE